ncbi:MAG: DnaJ domain-containing protein [Parachlamydiales bacterium]|jgi:hypothetical protein
MSVNNSLGFNLNARSFVPATTSKVPEVEFNPEYTAQKTYSELGSRLSFSMIGTKVLRVYPCTVGGEHLWTFVPPSLFLDDIRNSSLIFSRFVDRKPLFIVNGKETFFLPEFNDANWITEEDFLNHREKIREKTAPRLHGANPSNSHQEVISAGKVNARSLTPQDKGKKFVRITPMVDEAVCEYYWDFVPKDNETPQELQNRIPFLTALTDETMTFSLHRQDEEYPIECNEAVWITINEYFAYKKEHGPAADAPKWGAHPVKLQLIVSDEKFPLLSEADIGKIFVRSYPHYDQKNHAYQWCYICEPKTLDVRKLALVLRKITSTDLIFSYFKEGNASEQGFRMDTKWNDGYWTPVDTYCEKQGFSFFENDPAFMHLPGYVFRRSFKELEGEKISDDLIGKKLVRLHPYLSKTTYKWKYIPKEATPKAVVDAAVELSKKDGKYFVGKYSRPCNDNYWMELNQFFKKLNLTYVYEPVDGHHPTNPEWKVFPELGEPLSEKHINKRVVRVYPYLEKEKFQWDIIPRLLTINALIDVSAYVRSSNKLFLDKYNYLTPNVLKDSYWIEINEFISKLDLPYESAPVDGRHPVNKTRVYTEWGEKLSAKHIGRNVLRVYPYKEEKNMRDVQIRRYNWQFIPNKETYDEVESASYEIDEFKGRLHHNYFSNYFSRNNDLRPFEEDSFWMSSDEFMEKLNIPFPYGPVDGHHPERPQQKVYPEWGEKLSEKHIGQHMVRVYPSRDMRYIWDYIPLKAKRKHINCLKLHRTKEGQYYLGRNESKRAVEDSYWLTAKEFAEKLNIPLRNAPVNGSDPARPERKVYPELGRILNKDHIGKMVKRVYPFHRKLSYWWDYIPMSGSEENVKDSLLRPLTILSEIKDDGSLVIKQSEGSFSLSKKWNDGNWALAEDIFAHAVSKRFLPEPPAISLSVYPQQKASALLGQKLKEVYVKEAKFIRSYPNIEMTDQASQWRFIPEKLTLKAVLKAAEEVEQFFKEKDVKAWSGFNLPEIWNDTHWITVDKYCEHYGIEKKETLRKTIKEWFNKIKKHCATYLYSENYIYQEMPTPKPETTSATDSSKKKDPKDPYEILGVPRTEQDFAVFKMAYRKLSRKYHPDKNKDPITHEKFKTLKPALETIRKNLLGKTGFFMFDPNLTLEETFKLAKEYYDSLVGKKRLIELSHHKETLSQWNNFLLEYQKCLDLPSEDKLLKLFVKRQSMFIQEEYDFYNVLVLLKELNYPTKWMTKDEGHALLLTNREKIYALYQEWVQKGISGFKTYELANVHISVYLYVIDSYIACTRQLVDLSVMEGDKAQAFDLREKLSEWIDSARKELEQMLSRAYKNTREFDLLVLFHNDKPNFTVPDFGVPQEESASTENKEENSSVDNDSDSEELLEIDSGEMPHIKSAPTDPMLTLEYTEEWERNKEAATEETSAVQDSNAAPVDNTETEIELKKKGKKPTLSKNIKQNLKHLDVHVKWLGFYISMS